MYIMSNLDVPNSGTDLVLIGHLCMWLGVAPREWIPKKRQEWTK